MKMKMIVVSLLAGAAVALAQGTFYVPNGLGNVEGNSSSTDVFRSSSTRKLVQIYSASDFGFAPGASGLVSSVAFRLDGATMQSFSGFWPSITLGLSTTTQSPDSLSPVFNNNQGSDLLNVFVGSFAIRATNTLVSPRFFEVQIPFSTAFWYDPARGNLSMTLVTSSGSADLILDAQNSLGDGVGRVFGQDGLPTGSVDTSGLVTRFGISPVPEPSIPALVIMGASFIAVVAARNRMRHRSSGAK